MKKLTRRSLDELAKTMHVIEKSEQEIYYGMYRNDCFWRCIAYMQSGGKAFGESDAESYAQDYYANTVYGTYGDPSSCANAYLTEKGAGMTIRDLQGYIKYAVATGFYNGPVSSGEYIAYFYTDGMTGYEATGTYHAVIVKETFSDGSVRIFDPQKDDDNNKTLIISAEKARNIHKIMY